MGLQQEWWRMTLDEIQAWLYQLLSRKKSIPGAHFEEKLKVNIFEKGIIDSLGLIQLVGSVEKQFHLELTSNDLQDERFQTIEGIANIIVEASSRL